MTLPTVGASLLAMVVNDNAGLLAKRGALESFASKLAPTGFRPYAGTPNVKHPLHR